MKIIALQIATILLAACAATDVQDERRDGTALDDFVEVNELESLGSIRTREQPSSVVVDDLYVIVSIGREDFLLEYFTPCRELIDGSVEPDIRKDARRLYARADTYRGCRIRAIYALQPGQAEEVRNLGESVGGHK